MSDETDLYYDSLYSKEDDSVHVLNDACFFFLEKGAQLHKEYFAGPGALKAYASWCPHCRDKVDCIKSLGEIFHGEDMAMYVINADVNSEFARNIGVSGFPTFFEVDETGLVRPQPLKTRGGPVHSATGIVEALCDKKDAICKYVDTMEKKGC